MTKNMLAAVASGSAAEGDNKGQSLQNIIQRSALYGYKRISGENKIELS